MNYSFSQIIVDDLICVNAKLQTRPATRHSFTRIFWILRSAVIIKLLVYKTCHALTCQNSLPTVPPNTLPTLPDSFQVEVEANILDKGYTAEAKIFYSYPENAAAVILFKQGSDMRYIFNYATDEIFSISGSDCEVDQLSTSNNIYFKWLLGSIQTGNGLHIPGSHWWINFQYGKDYGQVYLKNDTVRGVSVDHWQSCGKWQPNSNMLVDYYFSSNWTSASTSPSIPVQTEILADKQLSNGSVYSIHHIYDYFNYRPEEIDDTTVFQTPVGVICPGRKSTKPLPKLSSRFYVKSEIIYPGSGVTYEDVWYDEMFKLYRRDYKPLTPHYPTYSTSTLTEIHDYYIGARYVIDKAQGNCTTLPLSNTSGDAIQNMTAESRNGSYILNLRNPLQLFHLDWNYTYIGQVQERGLLCDVFVTKRNSLLVGGALGRANTTISFYFLAPGWDDYGNYAITAAGYAIPVKMELMADQLGTGVVYNYVDYSLKPLLETYDVSTCFPEAHKVKFQVKFRGTVKPIMAPVIKEEANMMFAQQLGVSWLRIQEVGVVYDDAFTYISATLLDKTPPTAQFEYIPGKVSERQDDSIIYHILTPMSCASFCINQKTFICNSFDFCANDRTCRLSRAHIGDRKVLNSRTCDHFSRTVNGILDEPSIEDAFKQLKMRIYSNHTVTITLSPGQQLRAVDVTVTFGWLTSQVKMPTIQEYLHYKIEASVPALAYAYEGEVWYDKTFQLIRYDTHYKGPVNPYHTTNPLTFVNDFSTGLQYVIDRVDKNCTIQAIPEGDFGVAFTPQGLANSTWSLRIKTQYEILHIDHTYQFVGQQTVRGMLCNVFESPRTDFQPPGTSGNYQSIFRYFFLAKGWSEVSQESGGAASQPVRLEITVLQTGLFLQYNYYDFNSDRSDISVYDIHECFDDLDAKTFQVVFPGPYFPFLLAQSNMFQNEVIFSLARISLLPPLKFQRTRIDYDRNNVYVTTSVMGSIPIKDYFTHIVNGSVVKRADRVSSQLVSNAENCAQMCYEGFANLTCNSFYFCAKEKQCLFSRKNVPTAPKTNRVSGCEAYSRTVTSRDLPQLSNLLAITLIKNNVYGGKLSVTIPGPGVLEPYKYTASMVRTDIVQMGAHTDQNLALQQFTSVKNSSRVKDFDAALDQLSVDDCALACNSVQDFQCHGFFYCDNQLTSYSCWLLSKRPDQIPSNGTQHDESCSIYQRTYLDDYAASPGIVSMTTADSTASSVMSTADCAKTCTQEKSFQCKSFEFCDSTGQCLLFRDRNGGQPFSGVGPTCHQFIRNYLTDFQPVNAGSFVFTSVTQFLSVSVTQCAQLCVEQQGTDCHGFYYCAKLTACHLTSVQVGQPQVHVDTSSQAVFCNYYTRLNSSQNTTVHTSLTPASSSKKVTSNPGSISTRAPSSSVTLHTGTSSNLPSKSTASQSSSKPTVANSVTPTLTSIGASPTPQKQTADSNGVKSGAVVGVAFATFIVGLIIGALTLFLFNKIHSKSHEEYEMHITKHEM